ncbi:hypothetical protein PG997_012244 [Apiospora hydei]|uniref:Uncharacterized protein n=1 Tax=Apiospora hydei TaxID=1337664 RepID=A0ABR1V3I6_9PEZI
MPYQNHPAYRITSSGVNSQGNHYCHRDYGSSVPNRNNYHYSNRDGGYYYRNPDGSTYYDNGRGRSIYTAPNGRSYVSDDNDRPGTGDQAGLDDSSEYPSASVSRNASPYRRSSPRDDRSDGQVSTPNDSLGLCYDAPGYRGFDNAVDYGCNDVPNDEEGGTAYGHGDGCYDGGYCDDGGYDDDGYYDDGGYDDDYVCDY